MPENEARPPDLPEEYLERLLPSASVWLSAVALAVCIWLIVIPVDRTAAVVAGLLAAVGLTAALLRWSVVVGVRHGEVVAGAAHLPVRVVSMVEALDRQGTRDALGRDLDARSLLRTRPWVHRAVRITLDDPDDPVPAWIVSSRRPEVFAAAITAAKTSG